VDLARTARYAFADLYYRSRILADLVAQTALAQTVAGSAEAKLATNQAGQDEVLSAQAEVWRLQARILEVEHMVDEARYDLNVLRGLDVRAELPPLAAPAALEIPEQPDGWIAAARSHYPPLVRLRSQGEAYRLAGAAEGRMRWPMLELSAYYGFRFDSETEPRGNMIGFQASFPLPVFGLGKQNGRAASMDAMRQGAEAEALQLARELEGRLRVLHTTARHLRFTIDLYRDRVVPTSVLAYESALSGYAANRVPYTNLLLLASDVYRDRLALHEAGLQLARTLAAVRSFIDDPELLSPVSAQTP
jgi:outer membrane protein TolC